MKRILPKTLILSVALVMLIVINSVAQRVITGTVYREGKPAAGVTVEAHKSSESFMTSFDGKYKISASEKTKYLRFTFIDEQKKLDIEGKTENVFDFSFDGKIPAVTENAEQGVNLGSHKELIAAGDREFMNNFSMYDQFFRQKDYKSAMGPWRFVYRKYPKCIINIYMHGVSMYKDKLEKSSDWDVKQQYLDSIMNVYERRIKYFGEKGFVKGRMGADFVDITRQNENWNDDQLKEIMKKAYEYLNDAVELGGEKTEEAVLVLFMQTTSRLFMLGEFPKEKVVGNFETTINILEKRLAEEPNNENLNMSKDYVNQIFTISGAADCEALINLYTPKFDELAKDIDALKKMLRMLDKQDCTDSELFAKASEKLYELEPSPEAAFNMGRMFMKREQFSKGKEYYLQAIASEQDKELLSKYYYELGLFVFAKEQAFQEARSYARKSIENNANNGKAYILIGDIYATYSKNYGEKDFEHRSLYWLAVDYYNKAKKIDPEVLDQANEKIKTYLPHFPDKETLFFEGYQDGQAFKIGSWINETTTVRSRK